jgi:hypothetical protein
VFNEDTVPYDDSDEDPDYNEEPRNSSPATTRDAEYINFSPPSTQPILIMTIVASNPCPTKTLRKMARTRKTV